MPVVSDIKLGKKDASPRLQQLLSEIIEILNESGYQDKTYTATPAATDPGFDGEERNILSGATLRSYKYVDSGWWYSDLYTQVT